MGAGTRPAYWQAKKLMMNSALVSATRPIAVPGLETGGLQTPGQVQGLELESSVGDRLDQLSP